jgi:hypothetical protein
MAWRLLGRATIGEEVPMSGFRSVVLAVGVLIGTASAASAQGLGGGGRGFMGGNFGGFGAVGAVSGAYLPYNYGAWYGYGPSVGYGYGSGYAPYYGAYPINPSYYQPPETMNMLGPLGQTIGRSTFRGNR